MSEYDYTGDKTKNYFTAYLQKCIKWRRWNYLKKKENTSNVENPLEDLRDEFDMTLEEITEAHYKEECLLKECNGEYPEWNELSDQRLVASILLLSEEERKLIYQHVFEEKPFEEMSFLNGMKKERVKGVYYYAIRKIRNCMRCEVNDDGI